MDSFFSESDLIFSYTTKQAVIDGELVVVPVEKREEVGIKFPVYMTRSVWNRYVQVPVEMEGQQDLSGRLWDVLFMFALQARKTSSDRLIFRFVCQIPVQCEWLDNELKAGDDSLLRGISLKAVIQAQDFDDPSPAIFIMLPNED